VGTARAGKGGFVRKNTKAHFKHHAVVAFLITFFAIEKSNAPQAQKI